MLYSHHIKVVISHSHWIVLSDMIRLSKFQLPNPHGRYCELSVSSSIRSEVKLVLEELEVRTVDFVQLCQLLVRELGEVLDPGFGCERPPMPETDICSEVAQ